MQFIITAVKCQMIQGSIFCVNKLLKYWLTINFFKNALSIVWRDTSLSGDNKTQNNDHFHTWETPSGEMLSHQATSLVIQGQIFFLLIEDVQISQSSKTSKLKFQAPLIWQSSLIRQIFCVCALHLQIYPIYITSVTLAWVCSNWIFHSEV